MVHCPWICVTTRTTDCPNYQNRYPPQQAAAAGRPAATAPVLSSPLKYEHTWQSLNDSGPLANLRPFLNQKDALQREIMGQPRCNTRKNEHSKVEALHNANSDRALCTTGEVSLLGPCVNSPHNTATRLGTMWAARLPTPDKSAPLEHHHSRILYLGGAHFR